jgi:hypothetical protein
VCGLSLLLKMRGSVKIATVILLKSFSNLDTEEVGIGGSLVPTVVIIGNTLSISHKQAQL